jgi:GTP-binding protein HflX
LADLLLHVVDAASDERDDNIEQVNKVLQEIGADKQRQIMVYNKIDLLGNIEPHIDLDEHGMPLRVWISARQGLGIQQLYEAIALALENGQWIGKISLAPQYGQLRAQLFALGVIESETYDEKGNAILQVNIPLADINRLAKKMAFEWEEFVVS